MFPKWLKDALSGHGISIDLPKKYFGDNEKMSIVDWYRGDTFLEHINMNTTGIGYIFKTAIHPAYLVNTLDALLGRIFDIEIESVTIDNYKLLNDYRNFRFDIYIVKAYFELRKFSLWDVSSKMPLLFFVLCLLNLYDYENCLPPGILHHVSTQNFSLTSILELSSEVSKVDTTTKPERTFYEGITKFFRWTPDCGVFPYKSLRRDLDGIAFLLSSRESLQDALRNLPLDSTVITEALILQYDKLRRKF